ncbi:MAG: tetratricopeptide repeat protein [Phycisphaerales bacterium]|nr:MAG: tetratricopeptide repeat protein [Phycisphaerales bacterium]
MNSKMRYALAALLSAMLALPSTGQTQSRLRKAQPGEKLQPFTLTEMGGQDFAFEHRPDRVTVLAFLAAYQKRSERALDDLVKLVSELRRLEQPVDLLVVISGGEGIEYFRKKRDGLSLEAPMLIDADDVLWGRLGVVVTPTTILADREGAIRWIRAGHGYDFATDAQAGLNLALGIGAAPESDDIEPVRSLTNDSAEDRARRHARMGQILARKGEVESGIAELRKAEALTPNVIDVQLELASLLCAAGRPGDALTALRSVTPVTRIEEARVEMLSGWAHRQLGDLDQAASRLANTIALDPTSGRAFFELGKIHEQRGEIRQAMDAYRHALAIHYGEPTD